MSKEIKVIIIEAGVTEMKIIEKFDHSLENMQTFVGGYVEAIRVNDSITLWVNEEGKLQDLTPNFYLTNSIGNPIDLIKGNALIAGTDSEGETVSLTVEQIAEVQKRFLNRVEFNIQ